MCELACLLPVFLNRVDVPAVGPVLATIPRHVFRIVHVLGDATAGVLFKEFGGSKAGQHFVPDFFRLPAEELLGHPLVGDRLLAGHSPEVVPAAELGLSELYCWHSSRLFRLIEVIMVKRAAVEVGF